MRSSNFTGNRVDTGTLPRIGRSRRNAEIWRFKINDWFRREDDIVRVLLEKEKEVNRAHTLDECVELIKRKYWRENQKDKTSISVIDYANAHLPRTQIYIRIAMEEYDSLEDACRKA
ncbi:hypothetical protein H8356DRAFT_1294700 [Neocallimastix lanati (nom. inval.)]|nr:hypothetical protein H8356DRAFT_1294700 [Neocallimastix sp. JGI-2020a]